MTFHLKYTSNIAVSTGYCKIIAKKNKKTTHSCILFQKYPVYLQVFWNIYSDETEIRQVRYHQDDYLKSRDSLARRIDARA